MRACYHIPTKTSCRKVGYPPISAPPQYVGHIPTTLFCKVPLPVVRGSSCGSFGCAEQPVDLQEYRKFGKHLQKRQLDIPEYAASFVNYKALKKVPISIPTQGWTNVSLMHRQLIKQLSATPTLPAQNASHPPLDVLDPRVSLQANKATFFFRLVGKKALFECTYAAGLQ